MTDQAQHSDGERSAISWRAAVERSEAVARVFQDGRPVYGVDDLGHVVVANRAAAAFGGGQVGFGRAVPPGGTVAALVARFAMKAAPGDSAFERTRAILGLRASMLGLKLTKVDVAPRGALTLVTIAEGVAPLPNLGGLLGDPRDEETEASDPHSGFQAGFDRVGAIEPVIEPVADAARAMLVETTPTMEDPFSDASFAAFSPISLDADGWTMSTASLPSAGSADEPAFEPPMAAALMPDAVSLVDGTDEENGEAVSRAIDPSQTSDDLVTSEAIEADESAARAGGDGSETGPLASDDHEAGFSNRVGEIATAWPSDELPLPSDAITMGVIDRATVADSAVDRILDEVEDETKEEPTGETFEEPAEEPTEGISALLALDGIDDAEAVDTARQAERVDLMDTEAELSAFDPSAATETEDASERAEAPVEPDSPVLSDDETAPATPPAYAGRMEPHRFVWQMDGARRFTLVSRELADAVGAPGDALVGRTWVEVAGPLRLDPEGRVDAALARRDTWSGLTVWWPVEGAPVRVPVDLAALPSFGRNRTFDGYRGFGVCRTSDWREDAEALQSQVDLSAADGATAPSEPIAVDEALFADAMQSAKDELLTDSRLIAADRAVDDVGDAPLALISRPVESLSQPNDAQDMARTDEPVNPMAPLVASIETGDEDAVLRRMNADLHDAAHSALEDVTDTPVVSDAAALVTPVDPDMLALAEGSALPPDVALARAEPESFASTALAMDGAGLGDAVAELSDYLDPTEVDTPVAPVADADVIGLPTWHEPARLLVPDTTEIEGDASNRLHEAHDAIEDATAIEVTEVLDAVDLTEATVGAMGEVVVGASDAADASSRLITDAVSPTDEPVEAALILDDVEARNEDGSSEAPEMTTPLTDGLPVDDRFGLVDAVPEAGPLTPPTRGDRASLSEIAAALNQEMRAREAEAARAEADANVHVDDTKDSPVGDPATEGLVAFVPPQRPDNVIAAPIGPGAKVVTLPAGSRFAERGGERGGERGPLSPPERDAFRQIARVLGARMEDEPAPGVGLGPLPNGDEPLAGDVPRLADDAIRAATQTLTDDATTSGSDVDVADAPAPDALAPERTDRLVGSLGEAIAVGPRDAEPMVSSLDADGEGRGVPERESDARFVEARALTDLSIGHDEAAFVADGDLDAMVTAPQTRPFASIETPLDGAHDQDPFGSVSLDEGTDLGPQAGLVDDLTGEGPDARGSEIDDPADRTWTSEVAAPKATKGASAGSSEQPVLEEFPMAVAVVQGQDIPFANQAFLDLLRYASLDDLNQAGGLDALFAGPHALKGWTGDASIRPLPAITRDGEVVPVCVRIAKTRWADAPALVMAMEPAERAAAALLAPTDGTSEISVRPDSASLAAPAALVSGVGGLSPDADEIDPRARVAELEAVLDTATDGVAILNAEGMVVSMNRAGQALFGADAASLEGRKLADLLAPESRRAAQDYLDGLARNGVQSLLNDGREVIALEAGGGLVPLFMTIGRLGEGRGRAFCAVMRDITQWKKAEEELTAAKKHAELASLHKSDFLAKISHEIRTPLNAIMGFAEVMIDERFGPIGTERYKEYLKDIRTSGAHIMSLVNDLLDLSKIEAGKLDLKFEAVDLNAILRECVALMQPQANRERIIIRASLPTQVPPIVADSRSIRQIMLNLLSNAVKFTPAGGQVIVSTALEDQGQVALRVRDTGIGMTETEVTQALEPFRQVHTAKSGAAGTGLGLPLTKALVEANRAAFAIRSTPGQGTLVEIVFPSTRVLAS